MHVLCADGRDHVGRRQVVALQLGRVDPHAHRALRAEQLRLADAGNALDLGQHVARGVVAQRDRVILRVVGREDGEQQEVRARLVHAHALLRDHRRQTRRRTGQAVLHVHLGQIGVGAGREVERDGARAVGLAHRFHVHQSGRTVHLALDHADHAVFQCLGRGAGVNGANDDGRRRDRRVLRDRQLRHGNPAHHQNEQRDHPRENGAVDEELGHEWGPLLAGGRGRRRFGRRSGAAAVA